MSQRYVPPADNRYSRERSPPRLGERYEPPRAPRGNFDPGRGSSSFPPRGRGFGGRGDYRSDIRDREPPRDPRDSPPPAWGADRNRSWRDREYDRRDRRPSPRGRPPQAELRDFRDPPPRDVGIGRGRRSSRDETFSGPPQPPIYRDSQPASIRGRGYFNRGRGRGDFDVRGRRHGSFEDLGRARSRSPRGDDRWERDSNRDSREFERRDERRPTWREDDRLNERLDREREGDRFRREPFPVPTDHRRVSAPTSRPDTPHSGPSTVPHVPASRAPQEQDRDGGNLRRISTHNMSAVRDSRHEQFKPDLPVARVEASNRKYASRASSPLQAPQVPAFGSLPAVWNVWKAPTEPKPPVQPQPQPQIKQPSQPRVELPSTTLSTQETSTAVPKGAPIAPKADLDRPPPAAPKAELERLPPTGPKAERSFEQPGSVPRPPTMGSNVTTARSVDAPLSAPQFTQQPSIPSTQPSPRLQSKPLNSPPTQPRQYAPSPMTQQTSFRHDPIPNMQTSSKIPVIPLATSPTTPFSPPLGPRAGGPFTNTGNLGTNIPTGPKAERFPQQPPVRAPIGPALASSRQWTRPVPVAPTFKTGTVVPAKRDFHGEEREKLGGQSQHLFARSAEVVPSESLQTMPASVRNENVERQITSKPSYTTSPTKDRRVSEATEMLKDRSLPPPAMSLEAKDNLSVEAHAPLEGLIDDDEFMDLDEDDLEERDAKFERQKADLEAQKQDVSTRKMRGATPLEHLAYLGRMMLDTILIEELRPGQQNSKQQLLTPKAEDRENVDMVDAQGSPASSPPPLSTPSIGSPDLRALPFLAEGPLTPLSEMDAFHDNISRQYELQDELMSEMTRVSSDQFEHELVIREQYALHYRSWRRECEELDKLREVEERIEPLSAVTTSAVPVLEPPLTPAATNESRRVRGGLSTEYDLQKVLEESMLTATIESMNREKEALGSKPDYDREAVVPNMLIEDEQAAYTFQDTTQLRKPENALKFYQLVPAKDDFNELEHRVLIHAFKENPKQFGIIATDLPGRTYKDCINHYYATKWNGEYKPPPGKRKGRRRLPKPGLPALGRPKANALISNRTDIYDPEEYSNAASAVTDSGRPRRAAAPVFGEKEMEDPTLFPVVVGRKPGKPDTVVEQVVEKTVRKPRGPGREKSQRKVKNAAPTPRHLSMSPEKTDSDRKQEPLDISSVAGLQAGELDALSGLAAMQSGQSYAALVDSQQRAATGFDSPSLGTAALTEAQKNAQQSKPLGAASSYWSKQEERDFPRYLGYFGTDWVAIAQEMGTKTHTMVRDDDPAYIYTPQQTREDLNRGILKVKNYYHRLLPTRADLENIAVRGDEKRQRGEKVGAPPTPGASSKRKTDPSQPSAPRPIAPHKDITSSEDRPANVPIAALNRPAVEMHNYGGSYDNDIMTASARRPSDTDGPIPVAANNVRATPPVEFIPPHAGTARTSANQDSRVSGASPATTFLQPVTADRTSTTSFTAMARTESERERERSVRLEDQPLYQLMMNSRAYPASSRPSMQHNAFGQLTAQYSQQSPQHQYLRPSAETSRGTTLSDEKVDVDRMMHSQQSASENARLYGSSRYATDMPPTQPRYGTLGITNPSGRMTVNTGERHPSGTANSPSNTLPATAPKAEPRKTSNLMSILNNDSDSKDSRKPATKPTESSRPRSPTHPAYLTPATLSRPSSQQERRDTFGHPAGYATPAYTSSLQNATQPRPPSDRDSRDAQGYAAPRLDWSSRAGWANVPPVSLGGYGYSTERNQDPHTLYHTPRSSISGIAHRNESTPPPVSFAYARPLDPPTSSQQDPPPPPPPVKYQSIPQGAQALPLHPYYRPTPPSPPSRQPSQPGITSNLTAQQQAQSNSSLGTFDYEYRARQRDPPRAPIGPRDDLYGRDYPRGSRDSGASFLTQPSRSLQPTPASTTSLASSRLHEEHGRRTSSSLQFHSGYMAGGPPIDVASPRPSDAARLHQQQGPPPPPPPPQPPTGPAHGTPQEPRFTRPPPMEPLSMRAPSWTSSSVSGPAVGTPSSTGLGLGMPNYGYGRVQMHEREAQTHTYSAGREFGPVGGISRGETGNINAADSGIGNRSGSMNMNMSGPRADSRMGHGHGQGQAQGQGQGGTSSAGPAGSGSRKDEASGAAPRGGDARR